VHLSVCHRPLAGGTGLGMTDTVWLLSLLPPLAAFLALITAWLFHRKTMGSDEGTERMREVAALVREGAGA